MIMSAVHLHGGLLYCIPMVIPNANFAIGNSYISPFNSSVKKGTCRKTGFSAWNRYADTGIYILYMVVKFDGLKNCELNS